jgi:hypothetical protein
MKYLKIITLFLAIGLITSCSLFKSKEYKIAQAKTNFDIQKLDKNGLLKKRGTSLAYEFCIPNNESTIAEIKKIDSSISVYISSKGRIGCSKEEVLCIGETQNKDFKKIFISLSKLKYVKNINESLFE